jgi:hypothetical protein
MGEYVGFLRTPLLQNCSSPIPTKPRISDLAEKDQVFDFKTGGCLIHMKTLGKSRHAHSYLPSMAAPKQIKKT